MNFGRHKKRLLFVFIVTSITSYFYVFHTFNYEPIKVGILHSRTGPLAISEEAVIKSTLLAIKEINQSGGVLKRLLLPILVDGKSDPETFAKQAEHLITDEKVDVIFGCWTSASRKAVKPVLEKHNHLLFYPVQYEGVEKSPNIVYTGASPNQQIIPAVEWAIKTLGKKIFLVGSDYIFPRIAHEIIKQTADAEGGEIVGEAYIKLGERNIKSVLEKIKKTKPDVILNTVNGISNIALFQQIKPILPKNSSIISFSVSEVEVSSIGVNNAVDTYACWNYFQSLSTQQNKTFVSNMSDEYSSSQLINDPMEAAYIGVKLWAQAATQSQSTDREIIKKELSKIIYNAPEGLVKVDPTNQHIWKTVHIGKILPNGQFNIVWSSDQPIKPIPFPNTLLNNNFNWNEFSQKLYKMWGNKWSA